MSSAAMVLFTSNKTHIIELVTACVISPSVGLPHWSTSLPGRPPLSAAPPPTDAATAVADLSAASRLATAAPRPGR